MDQLHGGVIRVAESGHDLQKAMGLCKFRGGAPGEFVVDGLFHVQGRHVHLVVPPLVALGLGVLEGAVHELFEEGLVAVHEFQKAEGRENQRALHFLDLVQTGDVLADGVIGHQGDAVVGSALAVVEVFPAAQVHGPVGEKSCVPLLDLGPDGLLPVLGVVEGDALPDFLFADLGVEDVAGPVEFQLVVVHGGSS